MEKQILAMLALYPIVLAYMFLHRVLAMKRVRMGVEGMRTPADKVKLGEASNFPSYNLSNLFELPIIFMILCVFNMVRGKQSETLQTLAWVFVVSRYFHSLIHCTYNKVMHRFLIYLVGVVSFIAMLILSF